MTFKNGRPEEWRCDFCKWTTPMRQDEEVNESFERYEDHMYRKHPREYEKEFVVVGECPL
jgi:hypothetical protein